MEATEGFQHLGEVLEGRQIAINFSSYLGTHSLLPTLHQAGLHIFQRTLHTAMGARVGNKDPVMQISGIFIMVTDCCF